MIFNSIVSARRFVKPVDYSKKETVLSGSSGSWKAAKDCYITASFSGELSNYGVLYINGTEVADGWSSDDRIGLPGLYVRKGDVVSVGRWGSGTKGSVTVTAYFCK